MLIYLIARGDSMHTRQVERLQADESAARTYVRAVAGSVTSPVDELDRLVELRDRGTIEEAGFAAFKSRLLR